MAGKLGKGRSVTGKESSGIRKSKFVESFGWMSKKEQQTLVAGILFASQFFILVAKNPKQEIEEVLEKVAESLLTRVRAIPGTDVDEGFSLEMLGAVKKMVKTLIDLGLITKPPPPAREKKRKRDYWTPGEAFLLGMLMRDYLGDELSSGEHVGDMPAIAATASKVRELFVGEQFMEEIFPKGMAPEDVIEAERLLIEIFPSLKKFLS